MIPQLLTVEEAADRLHVSVSSLRAAMRSGTLPYIALGEKGAARRIQESDLLAFIETRRVDRDRAVLPTSTKIGNGKPAGVIQQLTHTGRK